MDMNVSDNSFRTLPLPSKETEAFWTGGAQAKLNILRCQSCANYIHPPRPICPKCFSKDVATEAVSGHGKIVSFTINYQAWLPNMPVPFVIAIVELKEQQGLRLTTNIIDISPDDVRIEQAVDAVFEKHEDIWLPMFRPADV